MMKSEVNALTGKALDWAVAKHDGRPIRWDPMGFNTGPEAGYWVWDEGNGSKPVFELIGREYSPSTIWAQGGPIVEKLRGLSKHNFFIESDGPNVHVMAWVTQHLFFSGYGPTLLIAAMRCYVAAQSGNEIDLPALLASQA